jgi:hypothetical protein
MFTKVGVLFRCPLWSYRIRRNDMDFHLWYGSAYRSKGEIPLIALDNNGIQP